MKKSKTEEKARASPITDPFAFDPAAMRRIPREKMHHASPAETELRNCKVRVTMYLDADIIEHFKHRAAAPNAAPYQTQINAALRGIIESDSGDACTLLADDRFIRAVAAKVRDSWRGDD